MANYQWRVNGGAFDLVTDWRDTSTGADPAITLPGLGDDASFSGTGGTVTGTGDVTQLAFYAGSWTLGGRFTAGDVFMLSPVALSAGTTLTLTGTAGAATALPYGGLLNATVTLTGATLDSAGATLTIGALYAAVDPGGVGVTVQGGSTVTTLGTTVGSGTAATLTVTGAGSSFTVLSNTALNTSTQTSGILSLGAVGQGSSGNGTLVVTDAGTVEVGYALNVGVGAGSIGSVTVSDGGVLTLDGLNNVVAQGTGSAGSLTIGAGGTLKVSAAAQSVSYALAIGQGAASGTTAAAVGTVTVQGTGALLDLNGNGAIIGATGTGTLDILDGSVAEFGTPNPSGTASLSIGRAGTGTVDVSGAGAQLTLTGAFYAGRATGSSGTVTVEDGAALTEVTSPIPGSVVLGGGGSVNGAFATGGSGGLTVQSGATATIADTVIVGENGASGTVTVSDAALSLGSRLLLGDGTTAPGGSGTLLVEAGGTLTDTAAATGTPQLVLGVSVATTGSATVTGAGSLVDMGLDGITLGSAGSGTLVVEDGGAVTAASGDPGYESALNIGLNSGSTGGLTVTGAGSSVDAAGTVSIGRAGTATLTVDDGASFTGGAAATATVVGQVIGIGMATPLTYPDGTAEIAYFGGTGTADILHGSTLTSHDAIDVGRNGSTGSLVVANASLAEAAGAIDIGSGTDRTGGNGTVTVESGATLRSDGPHVATLASIDLGVDTGTNGSLTATGAGSLVDAGGDRIDIGLAGTGTLLVEAGAHATAGDTLYASPGTEAGFSVGSGSGSGTATIDGAGSRLDVDGVLTIAGTGSAAGGTGSLVVSDGGVVTGTALTLWAGGTVNVDAQSLLEIGTGALTGTGLVVQSGATLTAHGGTITGSVQNAGTLLDDGALQVTGDLSGGGTLSLGGGRTEIGGTLTEGVTFTAAAALTLHHLSGAVSVTTAGLGASVTLAGITGATVSGHTVGAAGGSLVFDSLGAGSDLVMSTDSAGDSVVTVDAAPCYCPGTLIRTGGAPVPVERLAAGDRVATLFGGLQRIRWIGRRHYAGRFIAGQVLMLPVCIARGAIADGVPSRDLVVSPGHAIYLDGALVPAWLLVNGRTITQAASVASVTYIHIELDEHEVIFAEDCPAESFLDEGSRAWFETARDPGHRAPPCACAPRLEDGFALQAIQARLAARAGLPAVAARRGALAGYVDAAGPLIVSGWAQGPWAAGGAGVSGHPGRWPPGAARAGQPLPRRSAAGRDRQRAAQLHGGATGRARRRGPGLPDGRRRRAADDRRGARLGGLNAPRRARAGGRRRLSAGRHPRSGGPPRGRPAPG